MGGKRRRNTANTGDKALYKKAAEARSASSTSNKKDGADDAMYNAVDQFHNDRDQDFIQLQNKNGAVPESDVDSDEDQEAVMDLGVGGSSSDEDEDDDSDSDDTSRNQKSSKRQPAEDSFSSSDDDDDDQEIEDVRDWGRKKSAYYHGDTADLELGQDEEDAFLEEEAAKEVRAARLEEMQEEDFMLSDDDDNNNQEEDEAKKTTKAKTSSKLSSIRDITKLSAKDKKKLIEKQHPGLLQIFSHFSTSVQDLQSRTSLATKALFDADDDGTAQAIGCTQMGKKYLLTKALLQASTALNLAIFLLLKSEEASDDNLQGTSSSLTQFHPVMKRLQEWNVLQQKLKGNVEDSVEGLDEQLDNLIKAAKLMETMGEQEDDDEEEAADTVEKDDGNEETEPAAKTGDDNDKMVTASASSSDDDDDESSVDEQAVARKDLHNARFGLRPNELGQDQKKNASNRRRRAAPSDLGDEDDEKKDASRYLASAINTIEQRAATKKKKARKMASSEELVHHREADDDLRRGLQMMEEEMGKDSDEVGDLKDDNNDAIPKSNDDDEDGGFYAKMTKKSKAKKEHKKNLYAVAPKFPRMEAEIEGERPISRMIMKNRGLVAHKNKLNRNPRVKKREQYRKALIRRKGTVREVRTDEGHKYGGEGTGIKSRVSRSRKLGTT